MKVLLHSYWNGKICNNTGAEIIKHQTHIIEDEYAEIANTVIPKRWRFYLWNNERCALNESDELG